MWGCSYSQICSNFYLQRGEKQATNFPHLYLGQVIDLTFSKITEVYGRALVAGRVADAQLASPGFALATFYLRALVWAFSFRNNCFLLQNICFLLQNICFPKYLLSKLISFAFQICISKVHSKLFTFETDFSIPNLHFKTYMWKWPTLGYIWITYRDSIWVYEVNIWMLYRDFISSVQRRYWSLPPFRRCLIPSSNFFQIFGISFFSNSHFLISPIFNFQTFFKFHFFNFQAQLFPSFKFFFQFFKLQIFHFQTFFSNFQSSDFQFSCIDFFWKFLHIIFSQIFRPSQ